MTKSTNPSRPLARRIFLALLALLLLVPLPAAAGDQHHDTKRLVREYVERCMDGGDLACLEHYWPEEKAAKVRKSEELRRSYFPDLSYSIETMIAEGDRVAVVLRVTGHHTGPGKSSSHADQGDKKPIPPSGSALDLEEVVLYTVSDGRIIAGDLFSDRMPVAQALGYTVTPPGR